MIEIKIKGHLDKDWRDWFDDLDITFDEKNTILSGQIKDSAHLHGILNKIRDLNLMLISVNPRENIDKKMGNILKDFDLDI